MFLIEDDIHADEIAEFKTFKEAAEELERLAAIPWDQEPNRTPCTSWRTCGRFYQIIEYDTSSKPWKRIQIINALEVNSNKVSWDAKFNRTN